jgi:CDP-paratose 2-epimerase
MKILITGGCGFLGTSVALQAAPTGHDVALFDNLRRVGSAENLRLLEGAGRSRFHHGDIRSPGDVSAVIREVRPDAILHFAGQVAMTTSIEQPRLDCETNIIGTLNVLEAVRQDAPDSMVLFASTNKVYGDLESLRVEEQEKRYVLPDYPSGVPEGVGLDFRSPYGVSKGAADQYVLDYHRVYGLRTAVFRHSSMYGVNQHATFDQGWIGWFCQKAVEQAADRGASAFSISGNGKQVRDILYADDICSLYFAAMDRIDQVSGEAFNIGGGMGNSLSLLELFDLLEGIVSTRLRFEHKPVRTSDQKVFVADLAKAERLLGWTPKIGKAEGIEAVIRWLRRRSPETGATLTEQVHVP